MTKQSLFPARIAGDIGEPRHSASLIRKRKEGSEFIDTRRTYHGKQMDMVKEVHDSNSDQKHWPK